MKHYSCDQCGQTLDAERFIVRIKSAPARETEPQTICEVDLDDLNDLEAALDAATQISPEYEPKKLRFDLCLRCYRRFLEAPLVRELSVGLKFSEN